MGSTFWQRDKVNMTKKNVCNYCVWYLHLLFVSERVTLNLAVLKHLLFSLIPA